MDTLRFEARLLAEGYPEIRTNELPPSRHNPEHTHPFDVLALVLQGDITLTVQGTARTYRYLDAAEVAEQRKAAAGAAAKKKAGTKA